MDLKYIKEMVPNISQEIMIQMKNLNPGDCIAFGNAFRVPTILHVSLPNPAPLSNNVDLEKIWYEPEQPVNTVSTTNSSPAGAMDVATMMTQQVATQQFNQTHTTQQPQVTTGNYIQNGNLQSNTSTTTTPMEQAARPIISQIMPI
jgi:hypothetical protein